MKLFIWLSLAIAFQSQGTSASTPRQVVMLINEGFWAPEYYLPRQAFDKAGFKVTVAAKYLGMVSPDRRNLGDYKPVKADITYDQIELSKYDAITFAGGNGAWTDYFPNDSVHKILKEALDKKMVTALLCSSTGLLGIAGNYDGKSVPIAKGRHVTGYYRVESLMRNIGQVNFDAGQKDKPYVVVDGNLITGRDPSSAELFGATVVKELLK